MAWSRSPSRVSKDGLLESSHIRPSSICGIASLHCKLLLLTSASAASQWRTDGSRVVGIISCHTAARPRILNIYGGGEWPHQTTAVLAATCDGDHWHCSNPSLPFLDQQGRQGTQGYLPDREGLCSKCFGCGLILCSMFFFPQSTSQYLCQCQAE